MVNTSKLDWDYVLCNVCPTKSSEYFVLGEDVGKPGKGICPTCGTEIYHVRCDQCGEERELDKSCEEINPDNPDTWTCLSCKITMPLPTEKITIVQDLPPEFEEEFKKQGAAMRSKLRKILIFVALGIVGLVLLRLK